jgi:peptide/nickel transport system permease protein
MAISPYVLKKVGWAALTILFVIVLNFFLFRVLPGDPARAGIRDPRLTPRRWRRFGCAMGWTSR